MVYLHSWMTGKAAFIFGISGSTIVVFDATSPEPVVKEKWNSTEDLKAVSWDTAISIGLGGLVSMAILITAAAAPISDIGHALDMAKASTEGRRLNGG